MSKGYIIGHVTVANTEAYQEYITRNTPLIQSYGGKPLVRGGMSEVPEGEVFQRHVVFEFESYAQARALYYDQNYQEVARIRQDNAESMIVLVEGV